MFAAQELKSDQAAEGSRAEWQKEERFALLIEPNDDERRHVRVRADVALPVLQKIVTLIRRGQAVDLLKGAPMRFRKGQIVEDLHPCNAPVRRAQAATDNRLRAYGDDVHGC